MKANKKITIPLLATSFVLLINVSTEYNNQTDAMHGKSCIPRSEIKGDFLQEKSHYQYVGAEKCASNCHNNEKMGFQYNIWKSSPHSNAYKILVSERALKYMKKTHVKGNPQKSPVCLECHITGSESDSSYFTATYKKEDGVTCEACHKQKSDGKTYLPNKTDCLKCHKDSIHKMNKFNFDKKCAKIAHPKPTKLTTDILPDFN
jgi:hypothetical protein